MSSTVQTVQVASAASPTTPGKFHTPFCPKTCKVLHHDLIVAMFTDGRSANGRIQRLGELPPAMKQSIERSKLSNWDQNSVIPDAFDELRRPLLFLACAFAKTGIVEGLLRSNFDPKIQDKNGETALHFAANRIYKSASVIGGSLARKKDREEAFERILHLLTDFHPKLLAMKDNDGRTALHVSTTNLLRSRFAHGKMKTAAFDEFCFKSMIKKLLELEDAAIFTRAEVLEVIKTAKKSNGESVLHMLARDTSNGFHLLKFVQDLLFSGGALPDDKNRQNETIVSLAWKTDPKNAIKFFALSPAADSNHQTSPADSNSPQDSSTPSEQFEESIISNNDEDSMQGADVDHNESETSGNSLQQLMVPLFNHGRHEDSSHGMTHSDVSIPYITEAYSLSDSESCLQSGQVSDFNRKVKYSIMVGKFEESCAEVNAASPSKVKTNNSDPDDSFLRFVITEGIELDAPAKQNIVRVVLKQYSDKLGQIEDSLPKLGQLICEEETTLCEKKEELALLKKEITAKERSLAEMRRKEEVLCEEKTRLKRKVEHCHATQQQLEDSNFSKRGRSE